METSDAVKAALGTPSEEWEESVCFFRFPGKAPSLRSQHPACLSVVESGFSATMWGLC